MRLLAAPHPFKTEYIDCVVPDGLTLAEIVDTLPMDAMLIAHAHVWINDVYVPRDNWRLVRPNAGVTVTLRVVPQGGGGGGKNPLRTIFTIAIIAASFAIGPAVGAFLAPNGLTIGSSVLSAASLGRAVVTIAGTLLQNVIAPVRPPKLAALSSTSTQRDSPTLFIEGARNNARPFGVVPAVLGRHRMYPPLGAATYTEIIGDDQYMRMVVVWGYGPLKIEDIKIGETPIADFDDVEIETVEGRVGDAALTLFSNTVNQDNFSILLQQVDSWQTRTAPADVDELSVDITFPQGLVKFNTAGARLELTKSFQIQYRPTSGGSWLTPSFTATTLDPDNEASMVSGDTVTVTHNRTAAIRHGFTWTPAGGRDDYEVRIRRTSDDTDDTQIFDKMSWSTLRGITDEDPLNFANPLAATALRIRATGQLNRLVDELNGIVSSYVNSYDGGSWSEAVSSNNADLFRHVLQGAANAGALADARIDLDQLQDWFAFCVTNGFEFNMVRDFQASVWDTLADIASAGRASPTVVDGKWSVIYDELQTVPVQHFTPRNSWGFEAEKGFPAQPDALRLRFSNRNEAWRQDERIVYADGFTSANAEVFEGLDAGGITDPDHVWKFGRFAIAQASLRPERWGLNVDFEYLIAGRGALVLVTHDVLLVGLASGRITAIQVDGGGDMTGFTSDEVLTMAGGTDYGVSMRTLGDVELTGQIVTNAGDQTTVVMTTAVPAANIPVVGDLFSFGELGSETAEGLVLSIQPSGELSARVVIIPNSPAVYTADTGTIPAFVTGLTPVPQVPTAVIVAVRSDESLLELGAGNTITPRVGLSIEQTNYRGAVLDIELRATGTGEPFYAAQVVSIQGTEHVIGGVEDGRSYDFRVRWRDDNLLRTGGSWTYQNNYRVIGQTNPPAALINPTISVFGGTALIRWDTPTELDVRFGGVVRFRHSPETTPASAAWAASTSIGTAAKGDALIAQLPLKPGTYLARVYDKGGRPSDVVVLGTKQASVLLFANVDTVTEAPTFSGTKTNVVLDGNMLKLAGVGLFDAIPDLDLMTDDIDNFGGIELAGTYEFAAGFDLTAVQRVRLTSTVTATSVNTSDLIDDRTANMDDWESFDGDVQGAADCRVQVRHTDDDPAGSPVTWSAWNDLDSAEFQARGFEFKALLSSEDPAFNIFVTALTVVAEDI